MRQNIYFLKFNETNKIDAINVAIIVFVWLCMVILVNPFGDFPLNDDWAYAQSVRDFLATGNFQLPGWAVANLLPQVILGVLFCLPFGFSFTALRFSSLSLGLLGVVATYYLLKEITFNSKISLLGAFLIAFNPIYFQLSNTFMTDVPHYAVSVLSLYLFCLGIRKDSQKIIIFASLAAVIALLIRQVTGALLCGYLIAYIFQYKAKIKSLIEAALLFVVIPAVTQIIFADVFWPKDVGHYGAKEEQFVSQLTTVNSGIVYNFIYLGLCALLYLGVFLFPLLILVFELKYRQIKSDLLKKVFVGSLFFLVTVLGFWLISNRQRMPIKGNIINDWGLGPLSLRDILLLTQPESIPNYLEIFWILVTIVSIIGAALSILLIATSAVEFFFKRKASWIERSQIMANTSTAFIYFLPLGLSFFFDRYLLFIVPLLMSISVGFLEDTRQLKVSKRNIYTSLIATLIVGTLTIAATHDYLSWNRIRWQAIDNLRQEQKISPEYIDGGFEFNGWYLYDPEDKIEKKRKEKKVWWWVERDNYVISFSPIKGYETIKQYLLKNWLPFKTQSILVLKKRNYPLEKTQ